MIVAATLHCGESKSLSIVDVSLMITFWMFHDNTFSGLFDISLTELISTITGKDSDIDLTHLFSALKVIAG